MGVISALAHEPAFWGLGGAFIYAAPRWIACLVACSENGTKAWLCGLEFAVALITGAIAAAGLAGAVMGLTGLKEANAVSLMIGLLANVTAPILVGKLSTVIGNSLGQRLEQALGPVPPGDDKP